MIERVLTIGVYGKSESEFFDTLRRAGVDTFCDIRQRRGVRGSQYAFVNSTKLQAVLASKGIRYRYIPALAPSRRIRALQRAADEEAGDTKRSRQDLGATFKERYIEEVLRPFDSSELQQQLLMAKRVAFFCVEGNPNACHRSLVAARLCTDWNIPVENL
jgi:uncharacterized protein (DUF488 family)